MLAVQKKTSEISPETTEGGSNGIFFTSEEWAHLEKEIDKQVDETGKIDYRKAINNARYLAMLDESHRQIKEGKIVTFTDEEWENFVNEQNLLG